MPLLAISYRRQDTEAITGRIFDRLTLAYGKDAVFRDIDNIPAGTDFREHISSVLGKSDLLIVVIGRRWLGRTRASRTGRIDEQNDLVRIEVETALQQNLPIIPVLVGNAQMPAAEELPESIKSLSFRNAIRIDAGQDFDNHLSRLLRSVNGSIRTEDNAATPSTVQSLVSAKDSKANYFSARNVVMAISGVVILVLAFAIPMYLRQQSYREPAPTSAQSAPPSAQPAAPTTNPGELKTLLAGNEVGPLEAYLEKYPAEPRRQEALDKIGDLKRTEFTEWTVFETSVKLKELAYLKFDLIEKAGNGKFSLLSKIVLDPSLPAYIKDAPEGTYQESNDVIDCKESQAWQAEVAYFDKAGNNLYHYKWADPKYISDMVKPTPVAPGTILDRERIIVCNDVPRTPLVSKEDIKKMKFKSLSSTATGDGDIYYKIPKVGGSEKEAISIIQFKSDKKIGDGQNEVGKAAFGDMAYRTMVQLQRFDCHSEKYAAVKTEFYNSDEELKYVMVSDPQKELAWSDIVQNTPLGVLRRIVCGD